MTELNDIFAIPDLCLEISKHIPVIQTLIFAKYRLGHFWPNFRAELLRRMRELGLSEQRATGFLTALRDTSSVATGSLLLSVLVSSPSRPLEWVPGDIDICSPAEEGNCRARGCQVMCHSTFSNWLCREGIQIASVFGEYELLGMKYAGVWWGAKDQIAFNDIIIKQGVELVPFIFDTFDFDFCKIAYDGVMLRIFNPESILTRRCTYRGDQTAVKHYQWSVDPSSDLDAARASHLMRTYQTRMPKYRARGFEIVDQNDHGFSGLVRQMAEDATRFNELAIRLLTVIGVTELEVWQDFEQHPAWRIGWTHAYLYDNGWRRFESCFDCGPKVHPRTTEIARMLTEVCGEVYWYRFGKQNAGLFIEFRLRIPADCE